MNIFELISATERACIVDYINCYSDEDKTETLTIEGLPYVLRYWEKNKASLFSLLNGQLILKKNVEFKKPREAIVEDLYAQCCDINENSFLLDYHDKVWDLYYSGTITRQTRMRLIDLRSDENLINNRYDGPDFELPAQDDLKAIKISRGMKIMRAIGKVVDYLHMDKARFEEFRIAHSQVLNTQTMKGDLCLSIHPFDYMTMSDNSCGWDSCMSWIEEGCYRRGTVEMMNSPYVVVAYLQSKDPFLFNSYEWNSKKWRELFIINRDVVTGIKGYPYHLEALENLVFEWVRELAKKNWDTDFSQSICRPTNCETYVTEDDKHIFVDFRTTVMYNDCSWNRISCMFSNKKMEQEEINIELNYSGEAVCMICGSDTINTEVESTSALICPTCSGRVYCACCGDAISKEYAVEFNGEYYCRYCYNENHYVCDGCDNEFVDDNEECIYLGKVSIQDNYKYVKLLRHSAKICPNCFNKNFYYYNSPYNTEANRCPVYQTKEWFCNYDYINIDDISEELLQRFWGVSRNEINDNNTIGIYDA